MINTVNALLVDAGCFERGCSCYDSRDQAAPIEMVRKKEWVGLTDEQIDAATQAWAGHSLVSLDRLIMCREYARAIEAKLKEKNT